MARSFLSLAMQAARAADRAAKTHAREQQRLVREEERRSQQRVRLEEKAYFEDRQNECEELNRDLQHRNEALSSILTSSLSQRPPFEWECLVEVPSENELDADPNLRIPPRPVQSLPNPPGRLASLLPGTRSRYEQKKTEAIERYNHAISKYEATIKRRNSAHDKLREKAIRQNEEVDLFRTAYRTGNTEAVVAFSQFTLERSQLPDGFHNEHRHAYLPEDRQIVVEYRLPTIEDVIPDVERYRYTKSRDTIDKVARSAKSRQSLYTEVVAQVVLRAVSEIFRSDDAQVGEVVTVNGIVKDIDPATGQEVQPCIISVRCTREQYSSLNLRNVDAIACLRRLNAAVSRSAAELVPVKPILEFDMVDPRFIKEDDVISKLDNRTNLMDLSPSDFEHLITNLFQKMGLETRLTQASRDGGVDCVAYDVRPILGGKVVIQAKRYKNTVGVSAVRDLFGTMHNEGANKGILVTTSGYGTAAHEFATGKPIELITGSNLLYLLKEHAGLDAKIEAPADWIDAAAAE